MLTKKALTFILFFFITGGIFFSHPSYAYSDSINDLRKEKSDNEQIQQTIKTYYDLAYDIYLSLEMKDMSSVLNMDSIQNHNFMIALEENIIGWQDWLDKLYFGEDYRVREPIDFEFHDAKVEGDTATVTVNLSPGEPLEAYPPFVAFDENIFHLNRIDGKWLITEHYYQDFALFEVSRTEKLEPLDKVALQKELDEELSLEEAADFRHRMEVETEQNKFYEEIRQEIKQEMKMEDSERNYSLITPLYVPHEDFKYQSARAIKYALQYVYNRNPFFYEAQPVDCTNFVSQCLSYGFGVKSSNYSNHNSYIMEKGVWSAGQGGGFPAWESVSTHWNYMTRSRNSRDRGPRVSIVSNVNQLKLGGVMQLGISSNYGYGHTVICTSVNPLRFAQHSVNGIRNYNDYRNYKLKRFYNPIYFRNY